MIDAATDTEKARITQLRLLGYSVTAWSMTESGYLIGRYRPIYPDGSAATLTYASEVAAWMCCFYHARRDGLL